MKALLPLIPFFILGNMVFFSLKSFSISVDEIKYGSEFTFSSGLIGKLYDPTYSWSEERKEKYMHAMAQAQLKLVEAMKEKCPECKIEELVREAVTDLPASKMYKFTYPDGYWIVISNDPGVIETQAMPVSLKEYQALASRFQNDLFNTAKKIGLVTDTFMSGGHIHISLDIFKDNPLLLRNFLVDFINHFEIAEGILDLNTRNAPSLRSKGEGRINYFKSFIKQFDENKLRSSNNKLILTSLDLAREYFSAIQIYDRYNALNLKRFNFGEGATIEIRAIATQKSFAAFLQQITLFQARIQYLQKLSEQGVRIPVNDYIDRSSPGMNSKKFEKLLVEKYYDYVTESGLEWKPYKESIYLIDLRRKKITPYCGRLFL